MGRPCRELWKDYHFISKIIVFIILLCLHFFLSDVYASAHQLYVFGIGYFYIAFINIIIIIYAYVWFTNTYIWECCMIIATIIMLTISAFALFHDYYADDEVGHTRAEGTHFAVCIGLKLISIVILIIDVVVLLIKNGKGGSRRGATRGRVEITE